MLSKGFHDVPAGHVATIVTHLKMEKKPDGLRPARFAAGASLERQNQVVLTAYRDLFRRVGGDPWLWWSRLNWSDANLKAHFATDGVELYCLMDEGSAEGLLELKFGADGVCEIAYFGLTPKMIGRGAGRAMMTAAIHRAFSQDASQLYLNTCTLDSPQALGFYRHMGFTPFKQQVEIAPDPRLQGLLPASAGPNTPIFAGS